MARVRDLLTTATERLTAAGVESPRVDAELLLAAVTGQSRAQLLARSAVAESVVAPYEQAVARRSAREPLQHITGRAPFRHLELAVGPGVFVPRPETELLVDAVLPHLRACDAPVAVDLCAGSGALALALADEVPAARVLALERSAAALRWLSDNASGTTVQVVAGDVHDPEVLRPWDEAVDAVVSNPPYVPDATPVAVEVRADPAEAVFAGPDGLALLPAVVARAAQLLRPGGVLALEHDDTHEHAVAELLRSAGRWRAVAGNRDLAGRWRYTVAIRT